MAGAQGGSLLAVKGGNYLVPKLLLEHANTSTLTNVHVTSIRKEVWEGRSVYLLDCGGENNSEETKRCTGEKKQL